MSANGEKNVGFGWRDASNGSATAARSKHGTSVASSRFEKPQNHSAQRL